MTGQLSPHTVNANPNSPDSSALGQWVEIEFDCLPLRSVGPLQIPAEASPKYAAFVDRLAQAIEKHGTHNTYYLHRASCRFHVTNAPDMGYLHFNFEGTLLTDTQDTRVLHTDLQVTLGGETCDWLSEPIVQWFRETVPRAVRVEFERYIAAGDLSKTQERLERLQNDLEQGQGFLGMYL